jgi:membrane protease YdiL (CAAX protease family)
MTGNDPRFGAPADSQTLMSPSVADGDRTIDVTTSAAAGRRTEWVGGRIALVVAGIGLFGSALGATWFGLADRFGLIPTDLLGVVMVLVATALLVVGVPLLVGGLGYYVLAPAFMGPGMAWHGVGTHRLVIATTILIVVLANAPTLVYTAVVGVRGLCSVPGFMTAALSVNVALLGVTYLRFIRPGVLTATNLGLDRSRLAYHVGLGILVGVGVLLISGVIQSIMQAMGIRQTQLVSLQCVRDFPLAGFLGVLLAGGVLAPIAEELYFRGYVFQTYYVSRGPAVAYAATGLLFSVLHLNLPALVPILILSIIFAFVYRRTGSIVPSMVGHAVNNCTAFAILYFANLPPAGG